MHRREAGHGEAKSGGGGEQVNAAQNPRSGGGRRRGEKCGDESEGDRVLVDVDEDERGDQRDEKSADESSGRDQEVEAGQIGRGRAKAGQRAVAVERGQGEDQEVDDTEHEDRPGEQVHDREHDEGRGHEAREDPVRDQLAAGKGVHEGAEVEHERHDPQQRHRRHVGREVACDRKQQRARDRRQRENPALRHSRGIGKEAGDGRHRQRARSA